MKKNKFLRKIAQKTKLGIKIHNNYILRHPEFECFDFPKTFYFKYCPDRFEIHWAIIKEIDNKFKIYFINNGGRVFDELEFKKKKIAQRQLRKNGFNFSTNRFCPFVPLEPIYIKLSKGKKSAPYSKGNLWKKVQRNKKHFDKLENTYLKQVVEFKQWINNCKKQRKDLKVQMLKKLVKEEKQKNRIYELILRLIIVVGTLFLIKMFN